ncbi:hypothetical protein KAR91_26400 [Candidatus Pacearchaeota archaeon]|nr:hypothetical protein [Candidatus Pacearchaeota archaeon]
MQIIVFTNNGRKIPKFPNRPGLETKHVSFDTTALEELLLIARYRVINFPTSIIIDNRGKVLLKVKGSIPNSYVDKFVE